LVAVVVIGGVENVENSKKPLFYLNFGLFFFNTLHLVKCFIRFERITHQKNSKITSHKQPFFQHLNIKMWKN